MKIESLLRELPSVENVLSDSRISELVSTGSRRGIKRLVRESIKGWRGRIMAGDVKEIKGTGLEEAIIAEVIAEVKEITAGGRRRAINALGVIIHTNLGRSVLGEEVREEIEKSASGYIDLEVDLDSMERTRREARAARLFSLMTGFEDAHIVNNNAAAVFLAVETLAGGGAVAVSRGELVEIGGSFRLPEILSKAAGRVIELGTTNRTHLSDYREAVEAGADLILKVHRSNYRISGYTDEVSLRELVKLGEESGVPVMYDQGGGLFRRMGGMEDREEMDIGELADTGVNIIAFSCDKLLGGPQGGALLGDSELISRMRSNHLARVLRVGKLTLSGLEKTLSHYWHGEHGKIPVLSMADLSAEEIGIRAEKFAASLRPELPDGIDISITEGGSPIGGGTFPNNPLPTMLVEIILQSGGAEKLSRLLRGESPSVLVRVRKDSILIDLRTVSRNEENILKEKIIRGIGIPEGGSENNA
ncbi:MAG: L-seryl-tRNA(Sec) selenium transferase [Candidatus Latescibacteria bacterium]|nr:L-seryl-tRNA(Sec) selenium transferase [bacterium]MBD3423585.1 L-seryl-tRNA(Sec) selenium transferase [Candidatus Latescibacterota bacterium]